MLVQLFEVLKSNIGVENTSLKFFWAPSYPFNQRLNIFETDNATPGNYFVQQAAVFCSGGTEWLNLDPKWACAGTWWRLLLLLALPPLHASVWVQHSMGKLPASWPQYSESQTNPPVLNTANTPASCSRSSGSADCIQPMGHRLPTCDLVELAEARRDWCWAIQVTIPIIAIVSLRCTVSL